MICRIDLSWCDVLHIGGRKVAWRKDRFAAWIQRGRISKNSHFCTPRNECPDRSFLKNWYVIQVPTGKEEHLCEVIKRIAGNDLVLECFTPRFATEKKIRGEWVPVESLLLPGYLIVATGHPALLYERLKLVDAFTKFLRYGTSFCSLEDADCAWLSEMTSQGQRVIPMSVGVVEGDSIVVLRGPLKGHEALIKSINRRKSLAFIEFDMCGRRISTRVGLGIVRKYKCQGELIAAQ